MNRYGLFQRGVCPTLEGRALIRDGMRRYYASHPHHSRAKHDQALADFLAKVQSLLDQCNERLGDGDGGGVPQNQRAGDHARKPH